MATRSNAIRRYLTPDFASIDAAVDDAMSILRGVARNADGQLELPGHALVDRLFRAGHSPPAAVHAIQRLVTLGSCIAVPLSADSALGKPNVAWGDCLIQLTAENPPSKQQAGDLSPCHVTLLQMAAIVNRSKRTLQRFVKDEARFPLPIVEGGRGKPSEWLWTNVRPLLEAEYGRSLPDVFPSDRFVSR